MRKWLIETSWSSTKTNTKSCARDGKRPCSSVGWGPMSWKAALQERTRGSSWTRSRTWADSVPLQQRWPRVQATSPRKWLFPSICHLSEYIWSPVSSFGLPSTGQNIDILGSVQKRPPRWSGTGEHNVQGEAGKLYCSALRRNGIIIVFNSLMVKCREDWAKLLFVVYCVTRCTGHKL